MAIGLRWVLPFSLLWIGCRHASTTTDAVLAPPAFALHTFADAASRGLVCNDGSPAGYYLRRGTGAGLGTWVIYLEGGKFCESLRSCQVRSVQAPELMSSNGRGPTLPPQSGILSTSTDDNPDFATANHVVIPYCSSDLWSGDRHGSAATGGWHFRGRRIVAAVVEQLIDPASTPTPNLADARQVLIAGSSAGGVGVIVNADAIATHLPGVRVAALDDAGWLQDLDPLEGAALRDRIRGAIALWSGHPDDSGAQANPGAEWRCYFGAHAQPFLSTPLFGYMALKDKNLIDEVSGSTIRPPLTTRQQDFVDRFSASVPASLNPLDGAFAPNVIDHTAASGPSFWIIELDGQTLRSLLGNWFFQRGGTTRLLALP